MAKKIFFIFEGSTGATYIFNATNVDAVSYSLKFYKALTVKQKVMKNAFKLSLYGTGVLCKILSLHILKDKSEINRYLEKLTDRPMDFELDENSSILISPTRDKIIVHHHGFCFQKFAFGNSYEKVKNEATIYELLDRPLQNFEVSNFYDHVDSDNKFCSFKLSSQDKRAEEYRDITSALVEMFSASKRDKYPFSSYLEELKSRYIKSDIELNSINNVLESLTNTHKDALITLGLVHRDFKPWNINNESGILIYDFEETIIDGPPLEDMFNYQIDPIINDRPSSDIVRVIFEYKNIIEYQRYLVELEIELDYKALLYCYLIERILFYVNIEHNEIQSKYIKLFEFINKLENKKV